MCVRVCAWNRSFRLQIAINFISQRPEHIYICIYNWPKTTWHKRLHTHTHTHIVAFPLMTLRTEQIIGGNRIGSQIQLCFQLAPKSALS